MLETPKTGDYRQATNKGRRQFNLKKRKLSDITKQSVNGANHKKQTSTEKQCEPASKKNHTENSEKPQTRNDPKNTEYTGEKQSTEYKDTKTKDSSSEQVTVRFKWRHLSNDGLITISPSPHTAIIDALKTSDTFRRYNKKDAHSLIIHGNKIRAQINPSAPSGALKENEELELRSKKSTKQKALKTAFYPSCIGGLFIKVNKKGRTLGGQSKIILHNDESSKDGIPLAVFGYEHETVEEALYNDERFDVFGSFKLRGTKGETYESHVQLDQLPDDTYTVIILSTKGEKSSNADPQQEVIEPNIAESSNPPDYDLDKFALVPTETMRKTAETLRTHFQEYVKTHGGLRNAWRIIKQNCCNIMEQSRLSTHTLRLLVQHADSVGCIVTKQNGIIKALGTGFLLNGCVGLTCHHVVENILNTDYLAIIFKYDVKGQSIQEIHSGFHIEVISHNEVDDSAFFCVKTPPYLKCPGDLLNHVAFPPGNGLVSIIGHPYGQYQQVDSDCSVINLYDRVDEIYEPFVNNPMFMNILTKNNFLTYSTCFYHGSSGSPVLNDCGELVAMHQGYYDVQNLGKTTNQVEYGRPIVDIVINGAVKIPYLCLLFKDIVDKNILLYEYVYRGRHPPRMQPIIRQLLELWGTTASSPQFNDTGIGGDSYMESP